MLSIHQLAVKLPPKSPLKFSTRLARKLTYLTQTFTQFSGLTEKAIEIYLLIVMFIFPLLSFDGNLLGITIKVILFFIVTFILAVIFLIQLQQDRIQLKPRIKNFGRIVLAAFLYNLLFMISKIIKEDILYEPEIIVMTLCFTYVILSGAANFRKQYLYYVCSSSIFVFAAILFCYLVNPKVTFLVDTIVRDSAITASYAILVATLSVLLYCTEKRRWKRIFSGTIAGISFFVLFLTDNIVGICIVGILFLMIPIAFTASAELVKRNMQMAFLYFFMLSNMSLLTNYTSLVKVETNYSLTSSVYLDICMAVAGILFFSHWEKLPTDYKLDEIIMVKFKKICRFLLKAVASAFFMLILLGGRVEALRDFAGRQVLVDFVKKLQTCYLEMDGTLFTALEEYGIVGGLFITVLFGLIMVWLKRNFNNKSSTCAILTVISSMYLIQSFFIRQHMATTPVYIIFIIFAVHNRKIKSTKQKMEEENEKIIENGTTVTGSN